jgi:hypothetical protein
MQSKGANHQSHNIITCTRPSFQVFFGSPAALISYWKISAPLNTDIDIEAES